MRVTGPSRHDIGAGRRRCYEGPLNSESKRRFIKMSALTHESGGDRRIRIGEFLSIKPPPDWMLDGEDDDLAISGHLYSKIAFRFRPPDCDEVCLTFQLATLLHGTNERKLFEALLTRKGRPSSAEVEFLYPRLVHLAPRCLVEYIVLDFGGLGRVLRVDYLDPESHCSGTFLYAAVDPQGDDFFVISYVGASNHFSRYGKEVRKCIKQTRRI